MGPAHACCSRVCIWRTDARDVPAGDPEAEGTESGRASRFAIGLVRDVNWRDGENHSRYACGHAFHRSHYGVQHTLCLFLVWDRLSVVHRCSSSAGDGVYLQSAAGGTCVHCCDWWGGVGGRDIGADGAVRVSTGGEEEWTQRHRGY